jgi:(E)-4-hydroxy-3-methylbut-2-enyl-diphosphate synthase
MRFFRMMWEINNLLPVILYRRISGELSEASVLKAAGELGTLLLNGFGDGIWLDVDSPSASGIAERDVAFGILQTLKLRITGTEYISCPTCGRTRFDIQTTLAKVKEATRGMKGLKIGVMGCIVNGPGEMAGADYGYVGAGPGKVSIYRKGEAVLQGIAEEEALDRLLEIMKADGLKPGG